MHTCYIIGAGDSREIIINKDYSDYIIAADGGLKYCNEYEIKPDLILGDFDSLGYVPKAGDVIRLPIEKDDTDMSYAVKYGLKKGYSRFILYGGTGGKRFDHTYANIALVAFIAKNGGQGYLVGDNYIVTAITNGSAQFSSRCSGDISVFAFDEKAIGVYESGLKYSLDNATLENSVPLGVSNSFAGTNSKVSVRKGTLVIIFSGKISDITIDK